LKRGEAAAFEELVAERSGEIYGLLFRLTENSEEARDLTQETFLRAFQSIGRFRGEADLRTWIYRIAINQARNRWRWWRRRRRDSTVSLDSTQGPTTQTVISTLAESSDNPEQQTLAHERELVLRSALHKVGQAYRETVILRDIEGFTYEEIASTLGINVGTVKSRLARGRQELRLKLEGSLSLPILEIGNRSDGRPAPAHIKLGAKWVEVRKRRNQRESNSKMKSEFETWPATPVEASLHVNEITSPPGTSRSCFFLTNEAAGVGRPFSNIANGQLAIENRK
jgi:RNA polymerase sigma-70 factor (ECF subfamily)